MNPSLSMLTYRKLWFGSVYSAKRYTLYVVLAFAVLIMSWEAAAQDLALAGQSIPDESIRLRILANSDSPADQLLKRKVRDAVIEQINKWVSEPDDIRQARAVIEANIPEIEQLVQRTLHVYGYDYSFTVELDRVDFPTKLYGNQVYPAGKYEALRISIGEGEGQNWWCVLFPPLCFVDMASGASEPVARAGAAESESEENVVQTANEAGEGESAADENAESGQAEGTTVASSAASSAEAIANETAVDDAKPLSEQQRETRFFLWEMLQNLWRWITSLVA